MNCLKVLSFSSHYLVLYFKYIISAKFDAVRAMEALTLIFYVLSFPATYFYGVYPENGYLRISALAAPLLGGKKLHYFYHVLSQIYQTDVFLTL